MLCTQLVFFTTQDIRDKMSYGKGEVDTQLMSTRPTDRFALLPIELKNWTISVQIFFLLR